RQAAQVAECARRLARRLRMLAALTVYLVWSLPGGGAPTTTWLDARGRELATRDGLYIAVDGALWTTEVATSSVPAPSCADLTDVGAADRAPGVATRDELDLVRVDHRARVRLA